MTSRPAADLDNFRAIADAIATLFFPHADVVRCCVSVTAVLLVVALAHDRVNRSRFVTRGRHPAV